MANYSDLIAAIRDGTDLPDEVERVARSFLELRLSLVLSSFPTDAIWENVKKTDDLETFQYFQRWSYKRIAQVFSAKHFGFSVERKELFAQESRIKGLMTKKEYELIVAQAESLLSEWNLIKALYPWLLQEEVIQQSDFPHPSYLFLEIVHRRDMDQIEARSMPYHEIKRPDKAMAWKEIHKLTFALIEARAKGEEINKWTKLKFTTLSKNKEVFQDKLYENIILCAAKISKENGEIKEFLQELSSAHEILAKTAQKDWEARWSRGYKHPSEIWISGNRYILSEENRKKEAHYDYELVRFVWSDDLLEAMDGNLALVPHRLRNNIPRYLQLDSSAKIEAVQKWVEEYLEPITGYIDDQE